MEFLGRDPKRRKWLTTALNETYGSCLLPVFRLDKRTAGSTLMPRPQVRHIPHKGTLNLWKSFPLAMFSCGGYKSPRVAWLQDVAWLWDPVSFNGPLSRRSVSARDEVPRSFPRRDTGLAFGGEGLPDF